MNMTADENKPDQERWRSFVRIIITYLFAVAYIGAVLWVINFSLTGPKPNLELAVGLVSGLGSAALGIVGFWFGGRKQATDMLRAAQTTMISAARTLGVPDTSKKPKSNFAVNNTAPVRGGTTSQPDTTRRPKG
jgi:hypothetical protein